MTILRKSAQQHDGIRPGVRLGPRTRDTVLIVGRTKMGGDSRCIGAMNRHGRALRLLDRNANNFTTAAPYQVGERWEIDYSPVRSVSPPHVEDVVVCASSHIGRVSNVRSAILNGARIWSGSPNDIFDGRLRFTNNSNGYVCADNGVPDSSTGFWIPDRQLSLREDGRHYDYPAILGPKGLSYVGEQRPVKVLPAGTLLRVSLARWWRPSEDVEYRCYLQLSGWF